MKILLEKLGKSLDKHWIELSPKEITSGRRSTNIPAGEEGLLGKPEDQACGGLDTGGGHVS